MNKLENKNYIKKVGPIVLCSIFAIVVFAISFITTHAEISACFVNGYGDYTSHIKAAESILSDGFYQFFKFVTYPMWHLLFLFNRHILFLTESAAASLIAAIANTATYLIIYKYLKDNTEGMFKKTSALFASLLMFVVPLMITSLPYSEHSGTWSPNTWYSPSNIIIKPFFMLLVIMFFCIYNRYILNGMNNKKCFTKFEVVAFPLLLVISCLAKPSGLQILIPSVALFLLIDLIRFKGKNLVFCLKIGAMAVPSIIYLFIQAAISFSGSAGITFSWLEVWNHFSSNIFISVILACAFPIAVIIITFKDYIKSASGRFSIIVYAVAFLELAILCEGGRRKFHANFAWGYSLAVFLLFVIATVHFLNYILNKDKGKNKRIIAGIVGFTLLSYHFCSGVIYTLDRIFTAENWLAFKSFVFNVLQIN